MLSLGSLYPKFERVVIEFPRPNLTKFYDSFLKLHVPRYGNQNSHWRKTLNFYGQLTCREGHFHAFSSLVDKLAIVQSLGLFCLLAKREGTRQNLIPYHNLIWAKHKLAPNILFLCDTISHVLASKLTTCSLARRVSIVKKANIKAIFNFPIHTMGW